MLALMQQQLADRLHGKRSLWGRYQLRHAVEQRADVDFFSLKQLG